MCSSHTILSCRALYCTVTETAESPEMSDTVVHYFSIGSESVNCLTDTPPVLRLIKDSLRFWIAGLLNWTLWIRDSLSQELDFRFPIVGGIPDSYSCTDSGFQGPGFRIPQTQIFPYSRISRTTLH